jgi:hypothetical protein
MENQGRGIMDAPLSRGMTNRKSHASIRLNTSVALVPPRPSFDFYIDRCAARPAFQRATVIAAG